MRNQFAIDVIEGLSSPQKTLSSKYFYNNEGSRIFQEIMDMPEYYLTNKELEIFTKKGGAIYENLNFNQPFNLIELGAGDGVKTAELIRHLLKKDVKFTYTPIDISEEANDMLSDKLTHEFQTLDIQPQTGDYFEILKDFKRYEKPVLLLFIGSNIGNYQDQEVYNLFQLFNQSLKPKDKLLVGVDLKKNPFTIREAYFDPHQITKRFNLNLLKRINTELGGDFDLAAFDFYVSYEPQSGEVKSYLVSLKEQTVKLSDFAQEIHFKNGETIWTELSKKYDLEELKVKVESSGFKLIQHFLDDASYFTDSLFEKVN